MFRAIFPTLYVALLLGVLFPPAEASAGKFSKVRDAVRHDSDSHDDSSHDSDDSSDSHSTFSEVRSTVRTREKHRRHERHHGRHHHHGGHGYGGFFLHPTIAVEANRVEEWRPPAIAPRTNVAPPFPAADGFVPNETPFEQTHPEAIDPLSVDTHGSMVRFFTEHGFKTDNVDRWGFGLLVVGDSVLGLQTEWNFYSEELPGGGSDELRVGDFNVILRIIDGEFVQGRVGVGTAWLDDAAATDFGVNFTAGVDLMPKKPVVISAEIDWSTIGGAKVFHSRVSAGARWQHVEIFGGYDYRSFGSVSLHGPMAGLRIWF